MKYGLWPEIIIFNLNPCAPCVPWIFLVAYGKKSLEEIFFNKMLPTARNILGR